MLAQILWWGSFPFRGAYEFSRFLLPLLKGKKRLPFRYKNEDDKEHNFHVDISEQIPVCVIKVAFL